MSDAQLQRIQKILVGILVCLALVVLVCLAIVLLSRTGRPSVAEQPEQVETPEAGLADITTFLPDHCVLYDPMPELTFTDADGTEHTLADFAGSPLVITFWASWCPDCHEQMEIVNECEALAEENGFTYILMDKLDHDKETKEQALAYLEENQIQPDTYFDDGLLLYDMLGMHNVPTTFFIDEHGILKGMYGRQITKPSVFEAYLLNAKSGSETVTENFVSEQMMEAGGIHSEYHTDSVKKTYQSDVLSESQGLILEYAVVKEKQELFDNAIGYVENQMSRDALPAWRVSGKQADRVNALIDDLRIYGALIKADELWGGYEELILKYRENLKEYGLFKGQAIDFYDFKAKQPADRLTLCYADFEVMGMLAEEDEEWNNAYEQALSIVKSGKISDTFPLYYSWYNYDHSRYEETDLNMSEALVTLLHLAQIGQLPEDAIAWLNKELYGEGIMAKYDVTGKVVTGYHYESTAVYALTAMIGEEIGDAGMTGKALNKMEKMRINDTALAYNGAFGNENGTEITSFDQIVPMLAYAYCAEAQNMIK